MSSEVEVTAEVHFAQQLASNQRKVSEKALKKIGNWFENRSVMKEAFTEDGMLKLWKGIYYYFWNLDKPLIQEDRAGTISKLVHCFKKQQYSYLFMDTFFQTMAREWFAVDRFRLEKFMMFTRKFLHECFQFLKQLAWQQEELKYFRAILESTVASPEENACPLGLKLHVVDIYMEELAKIGADELSGKQVKAFLIPYCRVLSFSDNPILLKGVRKDIFMYLLNQDANEEVYGEFPILKFNPLVISNVLMKWSQKDGISKKNSKYISDIAQRYQRHAEEPEETIPVISKKPAKAIRKRLIEKAAERLLQVDEEFRKEKLSFKKRKPSLSDDE